MNMPVDIKTVFKQIPDMKNLKSRWKSFLFLGILFIFLGFLSIAASTAVTLISVVFLGSILLITGIVQLSYIFWAREWSVLLPSLFAGVIYIISGGILLFNPIAGAVSLTLLLAVFYVIGGLFRMIFSITTRFKQWKWAFFSGAIKLILGLLIWQEWPESGLWIFGLFIGIDFILFGWFWVLLSLTARNSNVKID